MSARAAAATLFVVAALALPFPMLGLDGSFVPVARYAQLSAVLLALIAREGAGGMVGALAGVMVGHAIVYAGLLAGAAWLARRILLDRLSARVRAGLVGVVAVLLLVAASFAPLYDSQFHHTQAHARLWDLYR